MQDLAMGTECVTSPTVVAVATVDGSAPNAMWNVVEGLSPRATSMELCRWRVFVQ